MPRIQTSGLTIEQALINYEAIWNANILDFSARFVIIKEAGLGAGETFAIVPKITCCCCRFFMGLCNSNAYYTRAQADMKMIAAEIKKYLDTFPNLDALSSEIVNTLTLLEMKFDRSDRTVANLFRHAIPSLPLARPASRAAAATPRAAAPSSATLFIAAVPSVEAAPAPELVITVIPPQQQNGFNIPGAHVT